MTDERRPADGGVTGESAEGLATLAAGLVATAGAGRRAVLGVAGPPGAGKSTFTAELTAALARDGVPVALVAMDGFHLAQAELVRLDRAERKGAPDTFDADGYVALLRRLARDTGATVYAPEFRRDLEEPVGSAIPVAPDVRLVLTEGNYLLHDDGAWAGVRPELAACWYLDLDDAVRRRRLAARHERFGRTRDEAWERTLGSDEHNAAVVRATRARADLVIRLDPDHGDATLASE